MKRILLLLLFSGLWLTGRAECPEQIRAFYAAYLSNVLHGSDGNDALCARYLTPELVAKVERMGRATGADPVIRAQDATEDAVATLSVKALGGDWYRVTYRWKKEDPGTVVEIPLRARSVGGECRIDCITPPWHGSRYGDELLPRVQAAPIDDSSERSFPKRFYDAYTALYCTMPRDLTERLASLREQYLTPRAMEQFARAEADNRMDGLGGYDLLIGDFDFDCLWRQSLEITPLGADRFRVSYRAWDSERRLVVSVCREKDGYRIDGIAPSAEVPENEIE